MRYGHISNFPNGFGYGVNIKGMPVLNTYGGDVYWVDSAVGSNGNKGTFDSPFATIDYAIGRCTAANGDIIMVKPGHAETVSAAAGIDCDIEGVTIIGLGNGDNMPRVSISAAGGDIDIDAENVTIQNIIFDATAAVTATIDVNAAFFTMKNCLFVGSAAAQTHKIAIITDANANDMLLDGVTVQLLVADDGTTAITTTSSEAVRLVGADRAVIKNCYFSGDFTTSAINGVTTASKDVQILNNRINNIATENIAGGIDLVAACTGHIDGNKVYVDYAASNTALIDASSCVLGLNYVSNEANEIPVLHGALEAGDVEYQVSVAVSEIGSVGVKASTAISEIGSVGGVTSTASARASTAVSEIGSVGVKASTAISEIGSVGGIASTASARASTAVSEIGSVGVKASTAISEIGSVGGVASTASARASTAVSEVGSVGIVSSTVLSAVHSLWTAVSTKLSVIDSQV